MTSTVPPPKAEDFLRDILDYHGEMVISLSKESITGGSDDKKTDDSERWNHWKSLQYFWNLYPRAQRSKHGRFCNRRKMAELLVSACLTDPYGGDNDGATTRQTRSRGQRDDNEKDKDRAPRPLVKWGPEEWDRLKKKLQWLHDSLLRKDSHRAVVDVNREKPEVDTERSEHDIYNRRFEGLLAMITANEAVSPFREQLEAGAPVSQALLLEFRKHLDHISDRKVRLVLEQFLVEDPSEHSESSINPTLADADQVKQVLSVTPMNLHKFQKKLAQLMLEWHADTFKGRPPALVGLGYGVAGVEVARGVARRTKSTSKQRRSQSSSSRKSRDSDFAGADEENQPPTFVDSVLAERKSAAESPTEIEHMRRARKTLFERADDPFPESYETAAGAAKHKRGSKRTVQEEGSPPQGSPPPAKRSRGRFYEKKQTAAKVQFSSESSIDDEEEEVESIHMSDLPQRSEALNRNALSPRRKSESQNYESTRQRKRFTEEEKRAIREGVLKHGEGRWATIKSDYAFILNNRSNVQIKDCYRTMKKNSEV